MAKAASALLLAALVWAAGTAWALAPEDVLVVANKASRHSISLAKYYMEKRGIPAENLITIWITGKDERCSRKDYEKRIAAPVREHLKKLPPSRKPRCLVTMYGVPLKVSAPKLSSQDEKTLKALKEQRSALKKAGKEKQAELQDLEKRIRNLDPFWRAAAVDSELSLVLVEGPDLLGWLPNPYFYGYRGRQEQMPHPMREVVMVSRLDGPTPEVVRRLVDDSLAVEREGLTGKAYFDARWEFKRTESASGYGLYDTSIHSAAERVKASGRMPVVVDAESELFGPGQAPGAALYCGWYSLAKYVDAFTWKRGAIAYHIASQECQTLKNTKSRVWCLQLLLDGVAATVGPVSEPFVKAFPLPEVFFGLLVLNKNSLVECYYASLPGLSWKMVLVGDPLYRPFAAGAP